MLLFLHAVLQRALLPHLPVLPGVVGVEPGKAVGAVVVVELLAEQGVTRRHALAVVVLRHVLRILVELVRPAPGADGGVVIDVVDLAVGVQAAQLLHLLGRDGCEAADVDALKVLQTGMYGFALAAVVCKTGEIVSAALLHGLDDWLLFVLTFVVGDSLVTEYVSSDVDEGWATVIVYVICIALYIPLVVRAAHTLRDIDVPNRGAFFRERAGVVAAPAAPAAPVAAPAAAYAAPTQQGYPAQYVQPQQYVQQPQQYVQPQPYAQQPYAQQPPVPQQPAVQPVNPIPTQIPDENLFQTDRSDPRNIGQ